MTKDERWNTITHAAGIPISLVAGVILVQKAIEQQSWLHGVAYVVYSLSIALMYSISTAYHATEAPGRKAYLRIWDHAAIYIQIAATYTPFTLIALHGRLGWIIFAVVWSMAAAGIIFKLYFTGRFKYLSSGLYLFMGWIIVFVFNPVREALNEQALLWLFVGGLLYTVGVVFYVMKRWNWTHAVFHLFVVGGTVSHLVSVYLM